MITNPTDIFIGYEDRLIYEGFAALLSTRSDLNVLGGARNGDDVFNRLKFTSPKILIVEISIPNAKYIRYLHDLHAEYPSVNVLLISNLCNHGNISRVMETGIISFILKGCTKEDLYNAISHIEEGKKYYCSTITQLLLKEYREMQNEENRILTRREKEVLRRLINGNTNKEISRELMINESTVKTHRKNLMEKIGADNLLSLVRYACRNNLVDFGEDSFCLSCPYKA